MIKTHHFVSSGIFHVSITMSYRKVTDYSIKSIKNNAKHHYPMQMLNGRVNKSFLQPSTKENVS